MNRNKAERRHLERRAIARKYGILKATNYCGLVLAEKKGLHSLSKGKIHCSCPLCSGKTGRDGYTIADLRKIQRASYTD